MNCIFGQKAVYNYVFFNVDRHRIKETSFLESKAFFGAQLKYTWPQLESEKDVYHFDLIQNDLDFLKSKGKGLFIQIQDVSFDTTIINVPQYILDDPIYNGGAELHMGRNDEGTAYNIEGLVARRWDYEVANRFHILLKRLGEKFDGKIIGINLPETSVGFGTPDMYPLGYSNEAYMTAIKRNMAVLKDAFPNSVVIQYANFIPGDKFPLVEDSYLENIYKYANEIKAGMGGPDIKVYKWWPMQHSYKYISQSRGKIPLGVAVQWGNYQVINPKTKKQVTVEEIYKFARDELGLDFIFWSTQEPFYTERVIPFLEASISE
jgi:hypothetical protein